MGSHPMSKLCFRTIWKTKTRFLSIFAIIALGTGFFAGINATEPDMILSADEYFKRTNLSDLRVYAPLGLDKEDIERVKKEKGIGKVQDGYSKDLFLTTGQGNTYIVRVYSYNEDDFRGKKGLNQPVLKAGRLPEKPGEMAVEGGKYAPGDVILGSNVTLSAAEDEKTGDVLKRQTFTVVGVIDSPLYISFERGQTNIGDGAIDFFAFIPEEDFVGEKPTDLFIQTEESRRLTAFTREYDKHLQPIKKSLEKLGSEAASADKRDLARKLDAAKAELAEQKREAKERLAAGNRELLRAERDIGRGEADLKAQEEAAEAQLKQAKAELEEAKGALAKGKAAYKENEEKWQAAYRRYLQEREKLVSAKRELDRGLQEIKATEGKLKAAEGRLEQGRKQLEELERTIGALRSLREALLQSPPISRETFKQLIENAGLPEEMKEWLLNSYNGENGPAVAAELDKSLSRMEQEWTGQKEVYEREKAEYEAGRDLLDGAKKEYRSELSRYENGLAELKAAEKELKRDKAELDRAKREISRNEEKIASGAAEITRKERELQQALSEGRNRLNAAKAKLAEERKNYEAEKAKILSEIRQGEEKIRDSEKNWQEIPDEWFVFTRDGNPGYSGYGDDAERIGAVAKVFPLFFFLVAALVCLTTMTRMVEEDRVQIGTLKAIGYGSGRIAANYLIYGFSSSLLGSLFGLAVGFRLFPKAIMESYQIMYTIPDILTPYHWDLAVLSTAIALLTTTASTFLAVMQELRSVPARLMQPRAPKPGKRILLERITPLWSRLSFSYKVSFRNIFRYKRRFFMTVLGISGCTALLITGFGLSDSINDIMGKQFKEIFLYDGQVIAEGSDGEAVDWAAILGTRKEVQAYMPLSGESVDALLSGSNRSYEANLLIPKEPEELDPFIHLRERKTKRAIRIPEDGAVITEKLAELLNAGPGDAIRFRDPDNHTYEAKISAVAENYMSHYLYMSPAYYEKITGKAPDYDKAIFSLRDPEGNGRTALAEDLMKQDGVVNVFFLKDIADNFHNTLKSLDSVVLILIVSAGALAFVVLYNLTNINITERIKEIATVKVLGFRNWEVDAYVYRENLLLTLIGTLTGFLLGILLHGHVIDTMEIDTMMFGQQVHPDSFLWSALLTFAFSIAVNLVMHYRLKGIPMAESLKSVD